MTTKDHHTSAASHHLQAARSHREASRHFEAGKDPQHWAHQALVAHGHTLRAAECSKTARDYYARHNGETPKYPETMIRFPANALETAEAMGTILQGTQRHTVAADHHEAAARCHHRASEHYAGNEYGLAAHEAEAACDHSRKAAFQSHEAAKQFFDANVEFDASVQDIEPWAKRELIG